MLRIDCLSGSCHSIPLVISVCAGAMTALPDGPRFQWCRKPASHAKRASAENNSSNIADDDRVIFMSRASTAVFPKVRRLLVELGENVRLARKRRGLSAALIADRAGLSRPTLRAIERGDPGVTLGSLSNVLHSLGLEADLANVGRADPVGRQLQDAALSSTSPARRRKQSAS
jgi:DNA-binding XRE family transcriptional regulator